MGTAPETLRQAAAALRAGAPMPEGDDVRGVLAFVLDQEAIWAADRGASYPAETAPLLKIAARVVTNTEAAV